MRFLTPRFHGILDYAAAIALIVAPFLLGFVNTNILALCLSLVLGMGLLGYSLITDYTYSLFGAVSFKIHLIFDTLAGFGLVTAPFVFGFAGVEKVYYLVMGIGILIVVALTGSTASDEPSDSASAGIRKFEARFLTPKIHGVLDYAAVSVLIAAPFLLGFAGNNMLALCISLMLGVVLLAYSLITDYAYSLSGSLSFRIHLVFDALAGLGAIAVPFIFGFIGTAKIYYIVMGVGVLIVVALTNAGTSNERRSGTVLSTVDLDL